MKNLHLLLIALALATLPAAQAQKWINPLFDTHRLDIARLQGGHHGSEACLP